MFVLGIKIAAPAMAALIFTSAGLGICAKFVPQMNIMIVAFPLQIFIGLSMFGLTLEIMSLMTRNFIGSFIGVLSSLMVRLSGG
jgi:flagellar biosynthetic protein FliR